MSRYGMPCSSSSATSRSRSDSRDDGGIDDAGAGARRPPRSATSRPVVLGVDGELEVAGQLQHRPRHPAVGRLQRGLAGQPGRIPAQPELRQRPRGDGHLVDVDLVGQHPQPGPAGGGQRLARRRCGRRRRSAPGRAAPPPPVSWPGCPACTPAQCSGTDHSIGLPRASSRSNASSMVCWSRSTWRSRAAATHNSPSGSSENRSTEYSASTSIAAYQCFCIAPLSPLRRAIAVCSAADPQRVPAVQVRTRDGGDVGGGRGQLAVLHPGPAEQQSVPVAAKPSSSPAVRTARPMTLRARTGSPPCSAASVTSARACRG